MLVRTVKPPVVVGVGAELVHHLAAHLLGEPLGSRCTNSGRRKAAVWIGVALAAAACSAVMA